MKFTPIVLASIGVAATLVLAFGATQFNRNQEVSNHPSSSLAEGSYSGSKDRDRDSSSIQPRSSYSSNQRANFSFNQNHLRYERTLGKANSNSSPSKIRIYTCQSGSENLFFVYFDNLERGYFIANDKFPCIVSRDGNHVLTLVNKLPVIISNGWVSLDGKPFFVQAGQIYDQSSAMSNFSYSQEASTANTSPPDVSISEFDDQFDDFYQTQYP